MKVHVVLLPEGLNNTKLPTIMVFSMTRELCYSIICVNHVEMYQGDYLMNGWGFVTWVQHFIMIYDMKQHESFTNN